MSMEYIPKIKRKKEILTKPRGLNIPKFISSTFIWDRLKPGIYLEYADEDLFSYVKFTILKSSDGIKEIIAEGEYLKVKKRGNKIELIPTHDTNYIYVSRDRRCYTLIGDYNKNKKITEITGYAPRMCSFSELAPTNHYIKLWLNPEELNELNIDDKVPIWTYLAVFKSTMKEMGRTLYRFEIPEFRQSIIFDGETGIYYKQVGPERTEYLVGTNLSEIPTYPKPTSQADFVKIINKYDGIIRRQIAFDELADKIWEEYADKLGMEEVIDKLIEEYKKKFMS